MATIVSHSKKFIFFHLYKTAGTSVTVSLAQYESWRTMRYLLRTMNIIFPIFRGTTLDNHARPADLEGLSVFNEYYTFAFVRNPWDWQVSLYAFMQQNRKHPQHRLIKNMTFSDYIVWRCANDVQLQSDLLGCRDGVIRLDFVGRFERLQNDFDVICDRLGIQATLPRKKVSRHADYRSYYDNVTMDLVGRTYRADVEQFGYTF